MSQDEKQAVRSAIDRMRKKDVFEKVLGKEMRRAGLDYDAYVRIIGDIRDRAIKGKADLTKAAENYLIEQQDQ